MGDDDDYYLNDDDLINDAIANAQHNDNDDDEREYQQQYHDDGADLLLLDYEEEPSPHPEEVESPHHATERVNHGSAVMNSVSNGNSSSGLAVAAMTVPQQIITATTTTSLNTNYHHDNRQHQHHHQHHHEEELYEFERYTGLSSWRNSTSGKSNAGTNSSTGAPTTSGNEKHGATTMEATSWKKKEERVLPCKKKRHEDNSEDGDYDDDVYNMEGNTLNGTGVATTYSRSIGSQAQQLVHFREKEELVLLGKSWGRERRTHLQCSGSSSISIRDANDHANKKNVTNYLPQLGEESMAMTLTDGTRTFIKKISLFGTTTGHKQHPPPQEGGRKEESQEQCLLSLSMTELIRRADILQKREIQRKIERAGDSVADGAPVDENGVCDEGYLEKRSSGIEWESAENDAISNPNHSSDDKTKQTIMEKKDDQEKKVSFQLQTQSLQRKRQHHKLLQLQQRLWVDKHAPTSISHLLSDERTNREVLRALRAWDPYVFKKEAPARPTPAYPSKSGHPQKQQQYGNDSKQKNNGRKWQGKNDHPPKGGNKEHGDDSTFDYSSNHQRHDVRPDESSRVILLSGPPGVGKSTLAHIVCKHAGYHAIEVNASDERTASSLTERVTRAMESTTLDLGNFIGNNEDTESKEARRLKRGGGKPNCIILDEIDGADAKTSISALVDIIRANIPSTTTTSKGKKGKGSGTYLRRPIILICNHKYAPALRPLLPYARQFDVQPPNPERLTSRLRAVLAAERMSVVAGGMLLRRLVSGTGGDIRSCLYALQFASARAREVAVKKKRGREGDDSDVPMVDISSALMATLGDSGNGMKDMQSDVSSTVATVFRKNKAPPSRAAVNQSKRQKTSDGPTSNGGGSLSVDVVLNAVEHFGDNSKTLDCLFMNINRVSYVDPTLDRCCSAYEWLSEADMYRSHNSNVAMNNSAEHHSMQKFYIPTAAAAIHVLCCVETRPDLTFSTRPLSDCHFQNQANVSLVHRFMEGLAPMVRRGCGGGTDTVVSDVIPYGLWLLSAGDGKHSLSRQVSSIDLLSAEEKLAFSAHVETLRALGLTYVKEERTFDYKSAYNTGDNLRLEPEIDKLVKFEHMDDHFGRIEVPSLLKELLAHGAKVAAMREREIGVSNTLHASTRQSAPNQQQKKRNVGITESGEPPAITPVKHTDKSGPNTSAAKNFLGFRAAKAKQAKTARRAATVGFDRSNKVKLSNTGSGNEISKVIRFKYQKGFTQAVRAPCQIEDLL